MNSHIYSIRHIKGKNKLYIYSQMVCFEWCLPFHQSFLIRWFVCLFHYEEMSK